MKAAWPPSFWASAITCKVRVVLPPDSGPYTSITRPRGKPPTPSAASIEIDPVGITFTGTSTSLFPRRMMEPLPYCFSIWDIAKSRFFVFSSFTVPPLQGFHLFGLSWRPRRPSVPECRGPDPAFLERRLAQGEEKAKGILRDFLGQGQA